MAINPERTDITEENPAIDNRGISRRNFLALAARGLAFATAAGLGISKFPLGEDSRESLGALDLKVGIEEQFNIRLLTVHELLALHPENPGLKDTVSQLEYYKDKEEGYPWWEIKNLQFIRRVLESLPPNFYQPDKHGRILTIILEPGRAGGRCNCGRESHPLPHSVSVGFFEADAEDNFQRYFSSFVHELVHLITLEPDPRGGGEVLLPQYENKVNEILGGKFSEIRPVLQEHIVQKLEPLVDRIPPEDKRYITLYYDPKRNLNKQQWEDVNFYVSLLYGVTADWDFPVIFGLKEAKPTEFIANLGSHYTLGRVYFFRYYSEFFDPETVEEFYNFMKEDIFMGREY